MTPMDPDLQSLQAMLVEQVRALEAQANRAQLFEVMPLLYCETKDSVFVFANAAFKRFLGVDVTGWPTERWFKRVRPNERADQQTDERWWQERLQEGIEGDLLDQFVLDANGNWTRVWWFTWVDVGTASGCAIGITEPLLQHLNEQPHA